MDMEGAGIDDQTSPSPTASDEARHGRGPTHLRQRFPRGSLRREAPTSYGAGSRWSPVLAGPSVRIRFPPAKSQRQTRSRFRATAPVASPAAISTAASQILRTRSAKPMAVLLLIGRRAARDFAADDPVFVGVTRHRPLRVGIKRLLVAPLLDQKDVLVVVFRQHQVELQAAVITARALRMPAHQVDKLATVLRLHFELDDDHDLAHRRSFLDNFGHRCAIRHVEASARFENCGRFSHGLRRPAHDYADRRLRSGLAKSRSTSRVPLAHGSLMTLRWRKADSNSRSHQRATLARGVERDRGFADSPLERAGFELLVPRHESPRFPKDLSTIAAPD